MSKVRFEENKQENKQEHKTDAFKLFAFAIFAILLLVQTPAFSANGNLSYEDELAAELDRLEDLNSQWSHNRTSNGDRRAHYDRINSERARTNARIIQLAKKIGQPSRAIPVVSAAAVAIGATTASSGAEAASVHTVRFQDEQGISLKGSNVGQRSSVLDTRPTNVQTSR